MFMRFRVVIRLCTHTRWRGVIVDWAVGRTSINPTPYLSSLAPLELEIGRVFGLAHFFIHRTSVEAPTAKTMSIEEESGDAKTLPKFYEKFSPLASVFYAILVFSHMHFLRCASASESERSERERGACSRVPFALSCFFRDFRDFSCFSRFFAISDDFERKKAQKSPPNPSKPLQTIKKHRFWGPRGGVFRAFGPKNAPAGLPYPSKSEAKRKRSENPKNPKQNDPKNFRYGNFFPPAPKGSQAQSLTPFPERPSGAGAFGKGP